MNKAVLAFFTAFLSLSLVSDTVTPKAHRTIKGNETVYTSEQVDELISNAGKVKKIVAGDNVTISPTSGVGEVTINSSVGAKRIAMFIIPMNEAPTLTPASSYTQFELKASENNFSYGRESPNNVCYYCHSGLADNIGVSDNDGARIYVNHEGSSVWPFDERSMVKVDNTAEYPFTQYAPAELVVYVDVTNLIGTRPSGTAWLNSENNNLTWIYTRGMNSVRESDPGTENTLWHPIQPVKWLSSLPEWIN